MNHLRAIRSGHLVSCVTLLIASVSTSTSFADNVVFDNGDPSGGFGVNILSELNSINQVGDEFDLSSTQAVNHLRWWGEGAGQDFSLRIFDNAMPPSTTPLHEINLGTVAGTTVNFGGSGIFEYNADFSTISLDAGDYLISIVETSAGVDWFWSASCEDGCEQSSFRRELDGDAWDVGNFDMAFVLSVPEPNCGVLGLLSGLALLSRRMRRR